MQPVTNYVGYIELLSEERISGWAIAFENGSARPVLLRLKYKDSFTSVKASQEREDLKARLDIEFGGFSALFKSPLNVDELEVFYENTDEKVPILSKQHMLSPVQGSIDEVSENSIVGWCNDAQSKAFTSVELKIDEAVVTSTLASDFRKDIQELGLNNGYAGFRFSIPVWARDGNSHLVTISSAGRVLQSIECQFQSLSVLIVSENEIVSNPSRVFRCDNLQKHLQASGLNSRVVGFEEFKKNDWSHCGAIIFSRVGASTDIYEKVKGLKYNHGVKVIYETDDLVFFPWHLHDLGSVRSGVDDANNPRLKEMFANRLNLITLADAAITTTDELERCFSALGIEVLKIPNMVHRHEIRNKKKEDLSSSKALNILCMSGSPTHYKDFQQVEPALNSFVSKNKSNVRLTLLGRFQENLALEKKDNVNRVDSVPYRKMLDIVSQHDVCIVPLEFTRFNNAKSCLKYIECGARSVPVIASATEDYVSAIENNFNGFLCHSEYEWDEVLTSSLKDRAHLVEVGRAAQKDVLDNYCIETSKINLGDWIVGVIEK